MSATAIPRPPSGPYTAPAVRYDGFTVALHWATAALVISLFALAEIWGFVPHGTPLRRGMQSLHISLGVLLTMIFVARLAWRLSHGRRLPRFLSRPEHLTATMMHLLLYALLTVQIALGLLFAGSGRVLKIFWLVPISPLLSLDRATRTTVIHLHDYVAWSIIGLAGMHALAALSHHYIRGNGVLRRMGAG
ncbi:cytochrome b [Acidisoma sp. L85]|jgi:cytochrome b561|uniref:cytochrome b n=1 Tax=Acidisoma sp. L85 TaxID=1641850 RepID=UPI00131CD7DA|nr:cytochrome b/b6 domain-containing protein [Acidisoma sp. L85]